MVAEIKIDYNRCTGCKKCVEACVFGVLEWFENHPIVVDAGSCKACLECKLNCSADAISVEEK